MRWSVTMVSGSPPSSASAASPYANRCMYRCLDAAPVSRLILNHGYPLVHGPSSMNFFSVTGSRGCCHGRWNTAWMHACSWLIIYQLMKSQSLVSLQLCCQQLGDKDDSPSPDGAASRCCRHFVSKGASWDPCFACQFDFHSGKPWCALCTADTWQ